MTAKRLVWALAGSVVLLWAGLAPAEGAPTCGSAEWNDIQVATLSRCVSKCRGSGEHCKQTCAALEGYFDTCTISVGVEGDGRTTWRRRGNVSVLRADSPTGQVASVTLVKDKRGHRLHSLRLASGPGCNSPVWKSAARLAAAHCRTLDAPEATSCASYVKAMRTCRDPKGGPVPNLSLWGLERGDALLTMRHPERELMWMRFKRTDSGWVATDFDMGLGC